jgi:RNA-directed DNA polymerase
MNTAQPMYEWNDLPWKQFERQTYKLQKRIYQASNRGDTKTVHHLQRLLMKSWAARCLAVRKVTQDNRGKRTAGIDGIKLVVPNRRLSMAGALRLTDKASPTRRVWIPKPGSQEQRPLGIPTMNDRAAQALAKLALEPEWEAKFEPNSYGFRPGRSCHDAIEAIFNHVYRKAKYVLDADITKCFDRINHHALLNKLHTFPVMRRAIKAWLRAGVLEGKELFPTTEGTPQGGVISPLLANIALHGLETAIRDAFLFKTKRPHTTGKPSVIRYADDFVVLHPDLAVIERAQHIANAWLADMGLELKPSKTRITHTLHQHDGSVGFDFLGFNVRQHLVGKTNSGKLWLNSRQQSTLLGFKAIITPSKEAQRRHAQALSQLLHAHKTAPQASLIARLNPVIRGWANYYSTVCSKDSFSTMDHVLRHQLRSWVRHRHPNKGQRWTYAKYWHRSNGTVCFSVQNGPALLYHDNTPIRRHTKVKAAKSPFDGDWVYWATHLARHPELPRRVTALLARQQGKCARCGLYFKGDHLPELDHVVPLSRGGMDGYRNWQLLHRHCHDQKTAEDGSAVRGTYDKSQTVEEPDDAKVSRPVLQAGR